MRWPGNDTRVSVTIPPAGTFVQLSLAGRVLYVENSPATDPTTAPLLFLDSTVYGGLPCYTTAKYVSRSPFSRVFLLGTTGSAGATLSLVAGWNPCIAGAGPVRLEAPAPPPPVIPAYILLGAFDGIFRFDATDPDDTGTQVTIAQGVGQIAYDPAADAIMHLSQNEGVMRVVLRNYLTGAVVSVIYNTGVSYAANDNHHVVYSPGLTEPILYATGPIGTVDIDGSSARTIVESSTDWVGICRVSASVIGVVRFSSGGALVLRNYATGEVISTVVVTGAVMASADGDYIYVRTDEAIVRLENDGTGATEIVSGLADSGDGRALNAVGGRIYFVDGAAIRSCMPDGSDVTTLINDCTALEDPVGITIVPAA